MNLADSLLGKDAEVAAKASAVKGRVHRLSDDRPPPKFADSVALALDKPVVERKSAREAWHRANPGVATVDDAPNVPAPKPRRVCTPFVSPVTTTHDEVTPETPAEALESTAKLPEPQPEPVRVALPDPAGEPCTGLSGLRGIAKGALGKMSSTEYVDRIRDGEKIVTLPDSLADDGDSPYPLIALVESLPPAGTPMPEKKLFALTTAITAMLEFFYGAA